MQWLRSIYFFILELRKEFCISLQAVTTFCFSLYGSAALVFNIQPSLFPVCGYSPPAPSEAGAVLDVRSGKQSCPAAVLGEERRAILQHPHVFLCQRATREGSWRHTGRWHGAGRWHTDRHIKLHTSHDHILTASTVSVYCTVSFLLG